MSTIDLIIDQIKNDQSNTTLAAFSQDPRHAPGFRESVADALELFRFHSNDIINRAEHCPVSFPSTYFADCRTILEEQQSDLVVALIQSNAASTESHRTYRGGSFLLVEFSAYPHETVQMPDILRAKDGDPQLGYSKELARIQNRELSHQSRYLFHLIACTNNGFQMHAALAEFTPPNIQPTFQILPVDLLNAYERGMAGL